MKGQLWQLWREWLSPVSFALLFTQFGATAVNVDGVSMLPGLRHGELLLVPKAEGWARQLGLGAYQRGDVVVFKPPSSADYERKKDYRGMPLPWSYRPYLVKRVVGVPGDRVQVRAGTLYVNGQAVVEPRTLAYWDKSCRDVRSILANTPAVTVASGQYFVMGDNRSPGGSLDSRMFGLVDRHDIAGRAVLTLWPVAQRGGAGAPCNDQQAPAGEELNWSPRWLPAQPR
ncbi:signal peptidase I [Deinococcus malanensis]|uniref:Signal peptidase I n=1 Tax=Deinococcus malanensis TaxID=1706855 RepID=A0ABQ2ELL9_9DEIO|nr:signal peptidase I [Deinococcus malanensis]GGK16413.1 signal peptidase I [Deinococcus malanensis]